MDKDYGVQLATGNINMKNGEKQNNLPYLSTLKYLVIEATFMPIATFFASFIISTRDTGLFLPRDRNELNSP